MNNNSVDYSSLKMAKDPSWLQEKDYQYMKAIEQNHNKKSQEQSRG